MEIDDTAEYELKSKTKNINQSQTNLKLHSSKSINKFHTDSSSIAAPTGYISQQNPS